MTWLERLVAALAAALIVTGAMTIVYVFLQHCRPGDCW